MSRPTYLQHLGLAVNLAVIGTTVGLASAQQTGDPVETRVDKVFSRWSAADSPGCAVSVIRDGDVVYAKGHGSANLEYDVPITPSTVFHVASVSKQFTALAVQLLVNEAEVSWDDDIRTYVPELPDLGSEVTLRQLAHHTSGIRDQWSLLRLAGWRPEADVVTQDDVLGLLSRQRGLNFRPGTEYLYSNSGYTLLAVLVERVSGQSLRAFAAERIFGPLGMTDTHFHDDHQMVVPNRAYAYRSDGDGGLLKSVPLFETVGATSLFTTVVDLARWDENFYTFVVGGETGIAQLHERGTLTDGRETSYAFGLAHGSYRGFETVGHGGTDAGYRSEILRFPGRRLTVTVLCNLRSTNPARLARRVADVYLPSDTADARSRQTDSGPRPPSGRDQTEADHPARDLELTHLVGFYVQPATDVPLNLVVRLGQLATVGNGPSLTLTRTNSAQLLFTGARSRFEFTLGTDGSPTRLEARSAGASAIVYRRADPWRPRTTELDTYAGTYESAELDVEYGFRIGERGLTLWNRKLGAIPLVPTYQDGFYGGGLYLTFTRDDRDSVDGLTVSTPRARKIRFDRH